MGRAVGWILNEDDRERLLGLFPPRYERVIAHHVTLWGRKKDAAIPAAANLAVIGHADAGEGIEALVVTVDGTMQRPDGSTFHITWSLDPASGWVPKDSNALIADHDWRACDPVYFSATPGFVT